MVKHFPSLISWRLFGHWVMDSTAYFVHHCHSSCVLRPSHLRKRDRHSHCWIAYRGGRCRGELERTHTGWGRRQTSCSQTNRKLNKYTTVSLSVLPTERQVQHSHFAFVSFLSFYIYCDSSKHHQIALKNRDWILYTKSSNIKKYIKLHFPNKYWSILLVCHLPETLSEPQTYSYSKDSFSFDPWVFSFQSSFHPSFHFSPTLEAKYLCHVTLTSTVYMWAHPSSYDLLSYVQQTDFSGCTSTAWATMWESVADAHN